MQSWDWRAYLDYLKARAVRGALAKAQLADEIRPDESRRGSVDGSGTIQLHYIPVGETPPWDEADLARYDGLAEGGEWEDVE